MTVKEPVSCLPEAFDRRKVSSSCMKPYLTLIAPVNKAVEERRLFDPGASWQNTMPVVFLLLVSDTAGGLTGGAR